MLRASIAVLAAVGLLAASPTVAPAAAAPDKRECKRKKPGKKPRRCGGRGNRDRTPRGGLPDAKYTFESIQIDGSVRLEEASDGYQSFSGTGTASYRAGEGFGGSFLMRTEARQRDPAIVGVAKPVVYSATSQGALVQGDSVIDCDVTTAPGAIKGLTGIFNVKGNTLRVQWSLAPAGFNCGPGMYVPTVPMKDPLAQFVRTYDWTVFNTRRRSKLDVGFSRTWTHDDITYTLTWQGFVQVKRELLD